MHAIHKNEEDTVPFYLVEHENENHVRNNLIKMPLAPQRFHK